MASWRDYARQIAPTPEYCVISAISAISPVPSGTNGTSGTVPASIVKGLALLAKAPAPQLLRPELWPVAVADASRLASEGWVLAALKLGWSPLDLFGAVPDKRGDPNADGLAVKLRGRRVLAICTNLATVSDGKGATSFIYRGNSEGAVLLWELGRRQRDGPIRERLTCES